MEDPRRVNLFRRERALEEDQPDLANDLGRDGDLE